MARRKNLPESVRVKCRLSERLHEIRTELYGDRGGSEMARQLGLPVRTWYNYETGVTVPAEVLLRFVELTSVEPLWLLHGRGPKFRAPSETSALNEPDSVRGLLRTALKRLEAQTRTIPGSSADSPPIPFSNGSHEPGGDSDKGALIRVEGTDQTRMTNDGGPSYQAARREWLAAERDCRCVQAEGHSMAPIVADGALVAYSESEEPYTALDGKLVVAWLQGRPVVRWFDLSGRYGLLRCENSENEPSTLLMDLEGPDHDRQVRRVVWLSTPHGRATSA